MFEGTIMLTLNAVADDDQLRENLAIAVSSLFVVVFLAVIGLIVLIVLRRY